VDVAEIERGAVLEQYVDARNLAARQALYRHQRSGERFHDRVLALAELGGTERIVDVGCGNRTFLHLIAERGHAGPAIGLDLSPGMGPDVVSDMVSLPLRRACADVALCMHVLYHLPDQEAGAAELRRVVRPDGRALVGTHSLDHLREMDDLVTAITGGPAQRTTVQFTIEGGAAVLRTAFDDVEAHVVRGTLEVTEAADVVAFVASARERYGAGDDELTELDRRVRAIIERRGVFEVTTASGCFVAR
jgi:SAM-dependent methyltransferase